MSDKPKFTVTFDSAKVVNLDTGEEKHFTSLDLAKLDGMAAKGLSAFDDALEAAGGSAIQEGDDGSSQEADQ